MAKTPQQIAAEKALVADLSTQIQEAFEQMLVEENRGSDLFSGYALGRIYSDSLAKARLRGSVKLRELVALLAAEAHPVSPGVSQTEILALEKLEKIRKIVEAV